MDSRLKQIRKQLGLRQDELAEIFDCRKENISMIERGKSALSERNKKCLVKKFNLNPLWLEDENVPMLLPAAEHAAKMQETPAPFPASVPLFDMEKVPSLAELFRYTNETKLTPKARGAKVGRPTGAEKALRQVGWINIPGMPECDGALRVTGDAMSPILRSGDIVMYRQLGHHSEIFWGDMYLLAIETSAGEYVAVRYVRRSENDGMATLAGENPSFADTEVELSKIRAIAFVKASIRANSAK